MYIHINTNIKIVYLPFIYKKLNRLKNKKLKVRKLLIFSLIHTCMNQGIYQQLSYFPGAKGRGGKGSLFPFKQSIQHFLHFYPETKD